MSKEGMKFYSDCLKKKAYFQKKLVRKIVLRAFRERGTVLRVYLCPHCGNYHITKNIRSDEYDRIREEIRQGKVNM